MRLILHIGPHKTGSSYLQKCFHDNAEYLSSRGVLYPTNKWIIGGHGHAALVDEGRLHELPAFIQATLSSRVNVSAVVISTENFDRLSLDSVSELRELTKYKTTIVFYTRRFDSLLYSNWQEDVKFGSAEAFSSFLLRHISRPFLSRILNFDQILSPWAHWFGVESIRIADYDFCLKEKTDLFDNFLTRFIGMDDDAKPAFSPSKENVSFVSEDAEILRALQVINRFEHKIDPLKITKFFYKELSRDSELLLNLRGELVRYGEFISFQNTYSLTAVWDAFKRKYDSCSAGGLKTLDIDGLRVIGDAWIFDKKISGEIYELYRRCAAFAS